MNYGKLLEMAMKENELVKEAVEQYERLIDEPEMKRLAEIRMLSQMEEQAALEVAEGKGLERGEKIGLERGQKLGREQGQKDEKIKTAKKLLKLKMLIEQIQEITGLSEEEIKELNSEE